MKLIDLTGKRFGRLIVIKRATDKDYNRPHWVCKCSCGNPKEVIVAGHNLKDGHVSSCGCLRSELTVIHNQNMGDKIRCKKRKCNDYDMSGSFGVGHLQNNETFLFDLDDYEVISKYYWVIKYGNNGQYKRVVTSCKYQGKLYKNLPMHVILTGNHNIDHKNRNPLDNRRNNLRIANYSQNSQNRTKQSNNTSGVIGVSFDNQSGVWKARVNIDKHQYTVYRGTSFEEAVIARLKAENKYYGEFAPQKHLYEQYGVK